MTPTYPSPFRPPARPHPPACLLAYLLAYCPQLSGQPRRNGRRREAAAGPAVAALTTTLERASHGQRRVRPVTWCELTTYYVAHTWLQARAAAVQSSPAPCAVVVTENTRCMYVVTENNTR